VEEGNTPLDGTAFFKWLDTYDLGPLGWIGGSWRREGEQTAERWTFVISRRISHLMEKDMQPRRPSLLARLAQSFSTARNSAVASSPGWH
jgi:hypothetical protein